MSRSSSSLPLALAVLLAISIPAAAQHDHQHQPEKGDPQKLGTIRFDTSCSPPAQAQIERGVAMLHSFWYDQATQTFQAAAQKDPKCAIAWWGVAMSQWHPLWEPQGPNRPEMEAGLAAVRRARESGSGSEREQAYVDAIARFYTDFDKTPHLERVMAYEQAMEQLHASYPQDAEAGIFYALALQGTAVSTSPPDKTYARQKKSGALLEPLLDRYPEHPGIAHYIIHAYDYPPLAAKALTAARRYAKIAPDSPHAQHMPSHIFTRLGLWQDSIASNRQVIATARRHGVLGEEMHGRDYLVFAHLQRGEDELARKAIDGMYNMEQLEKEKGRPTYFSGLFARGALPARYVIERRNWKEAAELEIPPSFPGGRYAWAQATLYFARALGAARSGKLEQARSDVARLQELRQMLKEAGEPYWSNQVEVQRRAAAAWLAFASKKPADALAEMRAAVELEDSMDKHPVTPGAVIPARALLAEMLNETGEHAQALTEYEKLLVAEPNRFLALYGAGRAAEQAGEHARAQAHYSKLLEVTAEGGKREELRHASAFLRGAEQEAARR